MSQLKWEQLSNDYSKVDRVRIWNTYRTKVLDGWLVFAQLSNDNYQSITFYVDPEHQWQVKSTLLWEQLSNDYSKVDRTIKWNTYRTEVFSGWLVFTQGQANYNKNISLTFYPDPEHQWTGNSIF